MKYIYHTSKLIAAFLIVSVFSLHALAGGWPVKKGKFVIAPSLIYYHATKFWDRSGQLTPYTNGGYFNSTGVYVYGEYGLAKRVTLTASLPYVVNSYKQGTVQNSLAGLTDAELGARFYLTNIDFKYYFAVQGTAVVPLYKNTPTTYYGYQSGGGEIRLIGSGTGTVFGKDFYFDAEAGGRQYFANSGPFQLRYTGSLGLAIVKHNQISLGISGVKSMSTNKISSTNLVYNRDYYFNQASFTYIYSVNNHLSFTAGINEFINGRNTGKGTSYFFSTILKF